MSKVVLDVSMSLDGFTAGPNVREAAPMGDGGERLHAWMAGNGPDGQIDFGVRREVDATIGATVIGRRTFDLGVGPWGGTPWPGIPSFVVTHRARQDLLGNNGGMFAFDGLKAAVRRAKQAAEHKDVSRTPGNGRRASCEGRSSEGSQEPRVPGGDHPVRGHRAGPARPRRDHPGRCGSGVLDS